jgi:demethylmenaquinone methyltransferase/2-methoxy-6-polyprenyl-1,4-benzoquinol methylase
MATSLPRAFETEDAKRSYVRRLFATIADRYDLITRILSCGMDQRWKARLVRMSGAVGGVRALDLACGTGDIAFALAASGADVTGLDVTYRMVELARTKTAGAAQAPRFIAGDMMALPFPDGTFDLVTTGYGIRNVPRIETALAEIRRVLRPGGALLSLDFNRPERPLVRRVYLAYLTAIGSTLGWVLHRDPDTYRYIPESIRRYPGARGVATIMERLGFVACRVDPLLGGLMAINSGSLPATLAVSRPRVFSRSDRVE